jgi:hypothetical protein
MPLTARRDHESIVTLPLSIIDNFFTCHSLSQSKQILKELQEQLFNKSYPHQKDSMEHDNVCYFFEKIEELIDAAHLLNTAG